MVAWHGTKKGNGLSKFTQAVINALSPGQIASNSTRGSTPGLINPALGRAGGWIDHPRTRSGRGEPRKVRGSRVNAAIASQIDQAAQESDEEEVEEENEEDRDSSSSPVWQSFDAPDEIAPKQAALGLVPTQPPRSDPWEAQHAGGFRSGKRKFSQLNDEPLPLTSPYTAPNDTEGGVVSSSSTEEIPAFDSSRLEALYQNMPSPGFPPDWELTTLSPPAEEYLDLD